MCPASKPVEQVAHLGPFRSRTGLHRPVRGGQRRASGDNGESLVFNSKTNVLMRPLKVWLSIVLCFPGANCKSYFISYGQIDVSYGIFPIYVKIYNQNFTSIKNQYCSILLQISSLRTIKVRSSIVLCYHKMSLELIP